MKAFLKRIDAERDLLAAINLRHGVPELCGLTAASIGRWSLENREVGEDFLLNLKELARLIGCLSQRSGERFDEAHGALSSEIVIKMAQFKQIIQSSPH